jgi:hypothetical protein
MNIKLSERYSVKRINNLWYVWDKVEKKPVGKGLTHWGSLDFEYNKIKHTLPQDLPSKEEYIERNRQRSRETSKRRSEDPELRKEYREYNKARWEEKKAAFLEQKQVEAAEKKLLRDEAYKQVNVNKYYKKRDLVKKICPTCNKEFLGRPNKKYCKATHSMSHIVAKQIRKRLEKGSDKRIPKWQSKKELYDFYSKCPEGMQVDHVVPVNHPIVSGLHVINNLQYLSVEDNSIKSNEFDGTPENKSWIFKKNS